MGMDEQDIIAKFMADTSGFTKGAEEVIASSQAIDDSAASLTGGFSNIDAASKTTSASIDGMNMYIDDAFVQFNNLGSSVEDFTKKFGETGVQIETTSKGMNVFGTTLNDAGQQTTAFVDVLDGTTKSAEEVAVGADVAGKAIKGASKETEGFSSNGFFLIDMIIRATIAIGRFVGAVSEADDKLASTQNSMVLLTGNASDANDMITQLGDSAAAKDFGTQAVESAAQHMLLLGDSSASIVPEINAVADGIAAMGGDGKQLQPIIDQLDKLKEQSTVTVQSIDQLASAGLPAWQALASGLGTTVEDAEAKVKSGAVSGSQAFNAMMQGLSQYAGAAQTQSDSLKATWTQFGENAMKALEPVVQILNELAKGISALVAPLASLQEGDDRATKSSQELWGAFHDGLITFGQMIQISTQSADQTAKTADALALQSAQIKAASSSQSTYNTTIQQGTQATTAYGTSAGTAAQSTTGLLSSTDTLQQHYEKLYNAASQASTMNQNAARATAENKQALDDYDQAIQNENDLLAKANKSLQDQGSATKDAQKNTDDLTKSLDGNQKALDQAAKMGYNLKQSTDDLTKSMNTAQQSNFSDYLASLGKEAQDVGRFFQQLGQIIANAFNSAPQNPYSSTMPHFASGVQNYTGMAIVGEEGPELVSLNGGSVYPFGQGNNGSSLSSLAGLFSGGFSSSSGVPQVVNLQIMLDTTTIAQHTLPLIAPQIRLLTGNRR